MPFKYNNVDIEALQYNGVAVDVLQFNGVEVWTSAPTVIFNPSTYATYSGYAVNISLNMNATTYIVDEDDGNEVAGTWTAKALQLNKQHSITITNNSTIAQEFNVDSSIAGFPITRVPASQSRTIQFTPTASTQYIRITPLSGALGIVNIDISLDGGKVGRFSITNK